MSLCKCKQFLPTSFPLPAAMLGSAQVGQGCHLLRQGQAHEKQEHLPGELTTQQWEHVHDTAMAPMLLYSISQGVFGNNYD